RPRTIAIPPRFGRGPPGGGAGRPDALRDRGDEVALITQRDGGEDQPASYLVATPVARLQIAQLIPAAAEVTED
ncbi:MAG: hypothetical protein L0H88_07490, partial [Propionibacterium sp.]|nr:hypothetical protein [Propionibacterium sp.]